jgi:hypothetical protein
MNKGIGGRRSDLLLLSFVGSPSDVTQTAADLAPSMPGMSFLTSVRGSLAERIILRNAMQSHSEWSQSPYRHGPLQFDVLQVVVWGWT